MITDRDLALAAQAAYFGTPTWQTERVHAYLTRRDGAAILAFRGTNDFEDLVRDFDALPVTHPDLGPVHPGFLGDVLDIYGLIAAELTPEDELYMGSHSKGALEQLYFGGLYIEATGRRIARCSGYGTPRGGKLNGIWNGTPGHDYRNRLDPVPELPPWLERTRPLLSINVPAPAWDLGPAADHHIGLYCMAAFSGVSA